MTNLDEIKLKVKEMNESADVKYYASSEGFVYFKNNSWAAKTILELCSELKEKDAEIENLKKQVEDLKLELDEARDPVHCNLCGSCGVDMCCPAHGCAHPHIKSETLKEQSETILELYNELKEKDEVLEFYSNEDNIFTEWDESSGASYLQERHRVRLYDDFGTTAKEVLQKYKASEGWNEKSS